LGDITLRTLAKPAIVIPMTRRADDILEDMRAQGATLVIVVDEFGGTSGLLTLHDLLEGLVGRLRARDSEPEIGPEEADGSRVVSGSASLREVTEAVGLRFTAEDMADADTLSGVVMSRLGRVPTTGDTVVIDARTVTVESFSPQKMPRLRVRPRPAQRP
jgi:CBS domain containing-hemolysin-like protein